MSSTQVLNLSDDIVLPDDLKGPDGLHLTALGNAERLLQGHGEDFCWVAGNTINSAGTIYVWNGSRWVVDDHGQVRQWATTTARGLGALIRQGVEQGLRPEQAKGLVQFWRASETEHAIGSMIAMASALVAVSRQSFDVDPLLLSVSNGVVDLRDGGFRAARREDYMTKMCNARFTEGALCPTWDAFLLATAGGDADFVRYLQQCAGICLTGQTEEHLFFIVTGPGGTGKTTFQETLKYVWGDYCSGIDPNSLAAAKNDAGRARPDIAKLPGVRLAFANESRAGLRIDEGLLKALTGNDTMTARELYRAEFDFVPTHKLWLRTNHAPQFDGGDSGMRRRTRLIPFVNVVTNKDRKLPEKLRAEADGILQWALRGWADYKLHGLIEPKIVLESPVLKVIAR